MRILEVLHFFLPKHSGGTEVYANALSRALAARGHEVHLFFTEKLLSRGNYRLERRDHDGLPCHVFVNNLLYESFEETFENPEAERAFDRVLDEVAPDVVHFHHLMLTSMGLPARARARGIPTLMTLHDFWLSCARFGQLLEHGAHVCSGPSPKKCASCMGDFKFRQSPLEKRMISAIRWTKDVAGFDLAPVVDVVRGLPLVRRPAAAAAPEKAEPPPELVGVFKRRARAVADVVAAVDRFLAPSRTVRERSATFGLPARRIRVLPLGIDFAEAAPRPPLSGREPVFGFIGTLAPHKGAHVAVEAMRYLKGHGRLLVYGRRDYYPRYAAQLAELAGASPVTFMGPVPRRDIAKAFARIDVLVMPSVWLENFPIVIQEARAAGVPVIASDLGGMAEAVRHGQDGLTFRAGDARDLARAMALLLREPERIPRLAAAAPRPLPMDTHAEQVEAELLSLAAAGRPPAARRPSRSRG